MFSWGLLSSLHWNDSRNGGSTIKQTLLLGKALWQLAYISFCTFSCCSYTQCLLSTTWHSFSCVFQAASPFPPSCPLHGMDQGERLAHIKSSFKPRFTSKVWGPCSLVAVSAQTGDLETDPLPWGCFLRCYWQLNYSPPRSFYLCSACFFRHPSLYSSPAQTDIPPICPRELLFPQPIL